VRVERRPVHGLVACAAGPGCVAAAVAEAGLMPKREIFDCGRGVRVCGQFAMATHPASSSAFSFRDTVPPRGEARHAVEVQEGARNEGRACPPRTVAEVCENGEEESRGSPDAHPLEVVFCLLIHYITAK
jgi:hypothetical protein